MQTEYAVAALKAVVAVEVVGDAVQYHSWLVEPTQWSEVVGIELDQEVLAAEDIDMGMIVKAISRDTRSMGDSPLERHIASLRGLG